MDNYPTPLHVAWPNGWAPDMRLVSEHKDCWRTIRLPTVEEGHYLARGSENGEGAEVAFELPPKARQETQVLFPVKHMNAAIAFIRVFPLMEEGDYVRIDSDGEDVSVTRKNLSALMTEF